MIGYIKGRVLSAEDGTVILENNGIGYEICCSLSVYAKLLSEREGEVFTYLAVREDGVSLYGFISEEEKKVFLKLISVSGVGPKMGINVLSCLSASDLKLKIASGDVKGLSAVKGLGKKTAERIILELQDKFDGVQSNNFTQSIIKEEVNEDALTALINLGFTKSEGVSALNKAKADGAESVEQLIATALRYIK